MQLFEHSAPFYDAIYAAKGKSYRNETERLCAFIDSHRRSPGNTLLDVACGTGEHLRFLRGRFEVTGTDFSPFMLAEARRKLPDVLFHRVDMCELDLGRRFDVVTCLFSAVGYLGGEADLRQAVRRMAAHLEPGGIVLIEPSLTPDRVRPAATSTLSVRTDGTQVTRTTSAEHGTGLLRVRFDYRVRNSEGERAFVEHHPMRLFTPETYLEALRDAGLDAAADEAGISGIGLFWGVRPGDTSA